MTHRILGSGTRMVFLVALGVVSTPLSVAQEAVDVCARCHVDALSLRAWDADALAQRIRELTESEAHVTPIPALSDEELSALAQALTEG